MFVAGRFGATTDKYTHYSAYFRTFRQISAGKCKFYISSAALVMLPFGKNKFICFCAHLFVFLSKMSAKRAF